MNVYALHDPRTGACRYVGRSKRPSLRLRQHLRSAHSARLRGWIEELRAGGFQPELRLLDGATEREWIVRLTPDLNVKCGIDENDPWLEIKLRAPRHEKEAFIAAAATARQSLSQWLIQAGLERAERQGLVPKEPGSKKKAR